MWLAEYWTERGFMLIALGTSYFLVLYCKREKNSIASCLWTERKKKITLFKKAGYQHSRNLVLSWWSRKRTSSSSEIPSGYLQAWILRYHPPTIILHYTVLEEVPRILILHGESQSHSRFQMRATRALFGISAPFNSAVTRASGGSRDILVRIKDQGNVIPPLKLKKN